MNSIVSVLVARAHYEFIKAHEDLMRLMTSKSIPDHTNFSDDAWNLLEKLDKARSMLVSAEELESAIDEYEEEDDNENEDESEDLE